MQFSLIGVADFGFGSFNKPYTKMNHKAELVVFAVSVVVLGSLLAIGVLQARNATRKVGSQNNLKQIGLAVHNFESAYRRLPAGCDERENHGWLTSIFPYMEASDWYSQVDHDVAWEHPINQAAFHLSVPAYCLPGLELKFTGEGYGITAYHANPALLHKGSKTTFAELSAGLQHVLLAGEIGGDYTPFGYTSNWREIAYPLSSGPQSYGAWKDGATFVLADGSVRFISTKIDPTVMQQIATAAPLPDKSRYEVPNRRFGLAPHREENSVRFVGPQSRPVKGGPPYAVVRLQPDGQANFIDFARGMIDVAQVIQKYPQAKMLRITRPKNAEDLELIGSLKELEMLVLMSERELSGQPASEPVDLKMLGASLKQLAKLKFLKLRATDAELQDLRQSLPNCEIVPSSVHAP